MIDIFRRRPGRLLLAILLILSCLHLAVGAETTALPAQDWNLHNLKRIQTLNAEPVTFAVLGDSRGNFPVFDGLLRQMARDPGLQFAIHLGDMVNKGELAYYQPFFKSLQQYLTIPMAAVVGNHELGKDPGGQLYTKIFGPRNYSFHLGNHYFIMFDDNAESGPNAAQIRWLEGELQKAGSFKTRLVFLHVPLIDPRGGEHHHCLPPESAARLQALFKQYRVACVFAGHIHGYFEGSRDGVPFVITGGGRGRAVWRGPPTFFLSLSASHPQRRPGPNPGPALGGIRHLWALILPISHKKRRVGVSPAPVIRPAWKAWATTRKFSQGLFPPTLNLEL